MVPSFTAILIIAVLLMMTAVLAIVQNRAKEKEDLASRTGRSWGNDAPKSYTAEAYEAIRSYSDQVEDTETQCSVDDITWEDCAMDALFRRVDQTLSSPGEDVLYSWFRHPLLAEKPLEEREEMIDRMEDPVLRGKVQKILFSVGRFPRTSYFRAITAIRQAAAPRKGVYVLAAALSAVLCILLFFKPVPAVVLMIPDFFFNLALHFRSRAKVRQPVMGFLAITRILRGAEEFEKLDRVGISVSEEFRKAGKTFVPFRRGAAFVTAGASVGGGAGEVLLTYLNIFFHLDMIFYSDAVEAVQSHEGELLLLFARIGEADAAVSAASFRASLGEYCRGSFLPPETAELSFSDLAHPLLARPVRNSLTNARNGLITGANASGKSTFLKSIALGAVLAQSIATVPAKSWRAPFFRIYTSMAIRDNLFRGESYFVVEIRSLSRIGQAADRGGAPVLAIIDEVLRGTNTVERIAASSHILAAYSARKCVVFAATHDSELTDILASVYTNWHFCGRVEHGDVHFDYRLCPGPTKERNAIALLGLNGFSESLADSAEKTAQEFERTGEWSL